MALRQELEGETIIESRDEGAYLRLDAQGFTARGKRGRDKSRGWSEVTGFQPANVSPSLDGVPGPPMYQIEFFLRDPPRKGRLARRVVRFMLTVDDTLPGVYPDADEVVALMERWRQRHSNES